jgi:hypothetical protein
MTYAWPWTLLRACAWSTPQKLGTEKLHPYLPNGAMPCHRTFQDHLAHLRLRSDQYMGTQLGRSTAHVFVAYYTHDARRPTCIQLTVLSSAGH